MIDLTSYRAQVGCFRNIRYCIVNNIVSCEFTQFFSWFIILSSLLMIGGVELNPGPRDKITLDDVWRKLENLDYMSMPSPGEIRAMFGTSRVCEYPEYQTPTSTIPDPNEWGTDRHLDDLEEKLIKIQQWSEVTTSQQQILHEGYREIARRDANHRLVGNPQTPGEILYSSSDFECPRINRRGCSSNRSRTETISESDDMSSTASQSGYNNNCQMEDGARGNTCNATRKGSSIFTLNEDSRNLTSDERMIEFREINFEGASQSKEKSLTKLCDIVQSLRRVYEDNKKACHVVKKLLEIFNLNDEVNGKLEGDTKTILKEKFCRFLENSEPELDAYKDINKLFELLESGLTADEESTLQSTLENLCVKLNPELNCLQYETQPLFESYVPSEKELMTNEEDEVLIKLHNLSSDLSVTVLEERDGKTSVVAQSLSKKNGSEYPNTQKRTTNIPIHLSRTTGIQKENSVVKNQITSSDSNTSASFKQNMVLPRKNFGAYKEELFKKAISLGFTKDVEELEKKSAILSRRSQLALLERKVNGKYKSMHIAEERRKLGAPERIVYKPVVRKKRVDKVLSSSSSIISSVSTTAQQPKMSNTDMEEKVSGKKLDVNKSNRRKIILDILPVLEQDAQRHNSGIKEANKKESTIPETEIHEIVETAVDDMYQKSNLENMVQEKINSCDNNTKSASEFSNDTKAQQQAMNDSDVDNECFVNKSGSKHSNRRKTIHAIVTVTCDVSKKPQKYLSSNGGKAGGEMDKSETSTGNEQSPALVSKKSYTVIRSTQSEPINLTADESQRVPACERKKDDHLISSVFFIFFTLVLLYAVLVYGNFEFCYDKFENHKMIIQQYLVMVKDHVYEYKEECCRIFAETYK